MRTLKQETITYINITETKLLILFVLVKRIIITVTLYITLTTLKKYGMVLKKFYIKIIILRMLKLLF